MLNEIIKNKISDIDILCRRHKVAQLFAFGSVCTDKFNKDSDIDFLVSFHKNEIPAEDFADNYFDLIFAFEKLFDKEVDLVSEGALRNPYFIKTMAKTKTPVYAG